MVGGTGAGGLWSMICPRDSSGCSRSSRRGGRLSSMICIQSSVRSGLRGRRERDVNVRKVQLGLFRSAAGLHFDRALDLLVRQIVRVICGKIYV